MKSIWCLFSIDNNYDQPPNNLVRWWAERPSIETLAKHFNYNLSQANDETVVAIVNIWKGEGMSIAPFAPEYRLQEVKEGEMI